MRCSVFIATSLDGFIAREDGAIDWLERANGSVPAGEDCGYAAFMATVDALVMGRHTFETVRAFPEWPYGETPVWVVSRSLERLPTGVPATVRLVAEDPQGVIRIAEQEGCARLYVDGGRLIQSFLHEGLITDLTITTIPVLIGRGRPLFGVLPGDVPLRLVSSRAFEFGFVQSVYEVG